MLHAVLKMFWGPLDKDENKGLRDMTMPERWVMAPLIALIFVMGLAPKPFLSRMSASVDAMITHAASKRSAEANLTEPQLLAPRVREQLAVRGADTRETVTLTSVRPGGLP